MSFVCGMRKSQKRELVQIICKFVLYQVGWRWPLATVKVRVQTGNQSLTWSVDCPSPFCSFLGSFSRMVKIQSSLPKSFPPDAWPSCSLIGQILKRLWTYIRSRLEVTHSKCLKLIVTNVGGKQHRGWFSPTAGCICVNIINCVYTEGEKQTS